MASEGVTEESKKRKRSQKSKQGPETTRKRRRADEDEVTGDESGEEATANGTEVLSAAPLAKKARYDGKEKHKGWTVSCPVGGRYLSLDPQFTSDGKYLVAAKEDEVRLLSLEDCLVQDTIRAPEGSIVSGFAVSPVEPSKIYIAFTNPSRVEERDWTDASEITSSTHVGGRIAKLCVSVAGESTDEVVYTLADSEKGSHIVRNGKSVFASQSRLTDMSVFDTTCVSIGSGKLVVGALREDTGRESVFDLSFKATSLAVRKHATKSQQNKKGVAFDLALGATTGEVYVYENIVLDNAGGVKGPLPTPRNLHWHREAVQSIKWSRDGNYLISGGRETVLVIWQLSSGKKQFLPHLSAEIEHITISPSGTSYALQLADNSLMVLSTSELKPTAHFPDIQTQLSLDHVMKSPDASSGAPLELPLQYMRTAGAIHPVEQDSLLLTIPPSSSAVSSSISRSFLQSFSISAQRHQYRQALTRNSLTDLNSGPNGIPIQSPDASHLALSADGKVMITVESWTPLSSDYSFLSHDEELDRITTQSRRDVYLKFWHWDDVQSRWSLETRVSNPHPLGTSSPGALLDVIADPTASRFFTLGTDSTIRIWTRKASDWVCKSWIALPPSTTVTSGNQRGRTLPPQIGSLAIAKDASLVACSLPTSSSYTSTTQVHLISTLNAQGSTTLQPARTLPPIPGHIHALSFTDRHLVVLTTLSLTIIDIPTLSQVSTHPLHPPKDKLPFAHRQRHLAITPAGLAAIAVPTSARKPAPAVADELSPDQHAQEPWTRVEVYATSTGAGKAKGRLFETKIRGVVMGLYARRKGWVAVTADGRVVAIEPPAEGRSVLERIKSRRSLMQDGEEEAERGVVVVDEPEPVPVTEDVDVAMGEEADEEGDKPVVRPEELARVFETKSGVREQYEGVLGLFSRRQIRAM